MIVTNLTNKSFPKLSKSYMPKGVIFQTKFDMAEWFKIWHLRADTRTPGSRDFRWGPALPYID